MDPAVLLSQMAKLVKDGRVKPSVIEEMLTRSGVELVSKGVAGIYQGGMLKVGGGLRSLDPNGITDFRMPKLVASKPVVEEKPAPKPVVPKPLVPKPLTQPSESD